MRKLLASWTILSLVLAIPDLASARACVGVQLPDSVVVDGTTLVLNGMGIREATALQVDVYVAGLYLPARSRDAATILGTDAPRRITMRLVRDVSREDALDGFTTGLRRNSPDDLDALRPAIARLRGFFRDMEEGETVTITYVPGHGTEIAINGTPRGTIDGALFGVAIFRNFIGPRPPNRGLRTGLLGGACE